MTIELDTVRLAILVLTIGFTATWPWLAFGWFLESRKVEKLLKEKQETMTHWCFRRS